MVGRVHYSQRRKHDQEVYSSQWVSVFILLALILCTVFLTRYIAEPQNFPIRTVQVQGSMDYIAPQELRALIMPHLQDGFVRLDMAQLRVELEGMPWVAEVVVRRKWPDTLDVYVIEQVPLARWAEGGLINTGGERFIKEPVAGFDYLPLFDGPEEGRLKMVQRYQQLANIVPAVGMSIQRMQMDKRRAVRLQLSGGIKLILGRHEQEQRLHRFVKTYAMALAKKIDQIEHVDMRYTNGFSVQWKSADVQQTV